MVTERNVSGLSMKMKYVKEIKLPSNFLKIFQQSEEMLSSQMLSGITEVDLGIDEKIRNIEATDAAKRKAAE